MNIKTWQERLSDYDNTGRTFDETVGAAKSAEIDELRAEIERLRGELADQVMGDGNTIAEQRKVLEQALEALENHAGNYKLSKAQCDCQNVAITAIQEQLK